MSGPLPSAQLHVCFCKRVKNIQSWQEVTLMNWVGLSRTEINEFNRSTEITFRPFWLVAVFQYALGLGVCVCVRRKREGNRLQGKVMRKQEKDVAISENGKSTLVIFNLYNLDAYMDDIKTRR